MNVCSVVVEAGFISTRAEQRFAPLFCFGRVRVTCSKWTLPTGLEKTAHLVSDPTTYLAMSTVRHKPERKGYPISNELLGMFLEVAQAVRRLQNGASQFDPLSSRLRLRCYSTKSEAQGPNE